MWFTVKPVSPECLSCGEETACRRCYAKVWAEPSSLYACVDDDRLQIPGTRRQGLVGAPFLRESAACGAV
jgi:hypothetical protein